MITNKMNMSSYIKKIIGQKKQNNPTGIFSICSANPFVIESSIEIARNLNAPLLIESTCNQVNQFGGYMNLKPHEFVAYIKRISALKSIPFDKIFLGGDHLGPSVWNNESSTSAMKKSKELVKQYVRAGYRKIHLDASMPCLGDQNPLPQKIIANREAQLCKAAIEECETIGIEESDIIFVVGTEVPVPGGSLQDEKTIRVSDTDETEENIICTKNAFFELGLESAWDQTHAIVVQPGVEFSDTKIHFYNRKKAEKLTKMIEDYDNLVFEAHSTDYQTRQHLRQLVEDHFSILKVGPALTFALREGLFALEYIEKNLSNKRLDKMSNLKNRLDLIMLENPKYWIKYYSTDESMCEFQRKFSFLDRSRYYLTHPDVKDSINLLMNNLSNEPIPLSLISQYFPNQLEKIKNGSLNNHPKELVKEKIKDVIFDYIYACGIEKT